MHEFKKALHSGPNGKSNSNSSKSNDASDKKRKDTKSAEDGNGKKLKGTSAAIPAINVVNLLSQTATELPVKGEDVSPDELIKSLQSLQNTASCDAAVRERISKLPPELSDLALMQKVQNKEQMALLNQQVDDAHRLLSDYNQRLSQELEDRKQISIQLAAYHRFQKQQLQETEKELNDYRQRLKKVSQVKEELKSHLQNLPDLTLLPSVTGGLAPLPTPNDLFTANKHSNSNDPKHTVAVEIDSNGSSPVAPAHSPFSSSPLPPAYEPLELNADDEPACGIEAEYVPSAVKFNEAGGIATSYSSTFIP